MSEDLFEMLIPEIDTMGLGDAVLPDPTTLRYYQELSRREIFINYDIDDTSAVFAKQIIEWNIEDKDLPTDQRRPIYIYINTPGGEANPMWSLIDAILLSKTPVYTVGIGQCASAGSMIFIAPPIDHRMIFPHAQVMVHKGSSGVSGDVTKIIDYSEVLQKQNEECKNYILTQTTMSEEHYHSVEDKDWYLSADECVKYGIAGSIVTDVNQLI